MTVRVCASVAATDTPELMGRVQRAERMGADLVEVRLDRLRSFHGLSGIARAVAKPLIATNRPLSEKGGFTGSEENRAKIIREAVQDGFAYADLEATTKSLEHIIEAVRVNGGKVILSSHDYYRTPDISKLQSMLESLRKYKPDVAKIVTTAHTPDDTLTILRFLHSNTRSNPPLVSFAMGHEGTWSRVLAPFYGASFTYASCERGEETAPGQLTVTELRRIYDILDLE